MTTPAATATSTSSTQDALTLLASDSSLAGDLSPIGAAMAGALDSGLGLALGLGKDLTAAGADAVASLAGTLTGDLAGLVGTSMGTIVTGVAASVPVIGAIINILSSVFGADFAAEEQQACEANWQVFAPRSTGSSLGGGSAVLPADLFFAEHATCLSPEAAKEGTHNFMPFGPLLYRSTVGMAWMQLLLGSIVYAEDLDWPNISAKVVPTLSAADQAAVLVRDDLADLAEQYALVSAFEASVERDAEIAPQQYAVLNPHKPSVGLPPAWRKRFRVLLRAIEALHRSPFKTATIPLGSDGNPRCLAVGPRLPRLPTRTGSSDGGVALWMIVADLVAAAFAKGYLTWDYALFLFTRQLGSVGSPEYNRGSVWWSEGEPPAFYNPDPASWWAAWLFSRFSDAELLQCSNSPLLSVGTASPSTSLWGIDTCPSLIVHQLQAQVTQWKLSTHPQYEQGQQAAAELEQSARAAARLATQPAPSAAGSPAAGSPAVGSPAAGGAPAAASSDDGPSVIEVGVGLGLVVAFIAWLRRRRPPKVEAGRYGSRWP